MFQDIIRLSIQRIFQDKILLGLVIVGILGIFVGGFNGKEEFVSAKHAGEKAASEPASSAPGSVPGTDYAANLPLDPKLANEFVKWWINSAFDYAPASAQKSHIEAANWVIPEANQTYQQIFWSPELAKGIATGKFVGAFQPNSVAAAAINPDGSVVVSITGTLILQSTGSPNSQPIQTDVLVRRGASGLRIAGIYNHNLSQVSQSETLTQ